MSYCYLCNGMKVTAKRLERLEDDNLQSLNPAKTAMEIDEDEISVEMTDIFKERTYRARFSARYCPSCGREL